MSTDPSDLSQAAGGEEQTERQRYERARQRVRELKRFYVHFAVYVVVNTLLHVIDFFDAENYWAFWPLIGWGGGVAVHAGLVFHGLPDPFTKWEDRKIREYMEKEKTGNHGHS